MKNYDEINKNDERPLYKIIIFDCIIPMMIGCIAAIICNKLGYM